jgi:hypothetical protein
MDRGACHPPLVHLVHLHGWCRLDLELVASPPLPSLRTNQRVHAAHRDREGEREREREPGRTELVRSNADSHPGRLRLPLQPQATTFGEALALLPCYVPHQRTAVAWAEALQRLPNWSGGPTQSAVTAASALRPKRGGLTAQTPVLWTHSPVAIPPPTPLISDATWHQPEQWATIPDSLIEPAHWTVRTHHMRLVPVVCWAAAV